MTSVSLLPPAATFVAVLRFSGSRSQGLSPYLSWVETNHQRHQKLSFEVPNVLILVLKAAAGIPHPAAWLGGGMSS